MLDSPSRGVVLVMVQVKPSPLPGGGGGGGLLSSPKALHVCWLIKSTQSGPSEVESPSSSAFMCCIKMPKI